MVLKPNESVMCLPLKRGLLRVRSDGGGPPGRGCAVDHHRHRRHATAQLTQGYPHRGRMSKKRFIVRDKESDE